MKDNSILRMHWRVKSRIMNKAILSLSILVVLTSCAIIRPGEVGVKQRLGKLSDNVLEEGSHMYNPFITKVIHTNHQSLCPVSSFMDPTALVENN